MPYTEKGFSRVEIFSFGFAGKGELPTLGEVYKEGGHSGNIILQNLDGAGGITILMGENKVNFLCQMMNFHNPPNDSLSKFLRYSSASDADVKCIRLFRSKTMVIKTSLVIQRSDSDQKTSIPLVNLYEALVVYLCAKREKRNAPLLVAEDLFKKEEDLAQRLRRIRPEDFGKYTISKL